ncbi:Flp pilus assembly protein CpaB [Vibrio quintilis]|uniref:Flp pilus assembly protein RcpC/CpaB domain-containing protein n=1 Tax=Vibrio quintilis TaxID=1117707 RepID=A0A1M7YV77_9VIBR|nr:Flp pilus assembly protein CpaB [Vibrio quintilis]SHO56522.1 hypothetical protein VQ7734_02291 [Vibrio quintilis]
MRSKLLMIMALIAIGAGLTGIFFTGENQQVPVSVEKTQPRPVFFKVYRVGNHHLKQGDQVRRNDLEIVSLSESEAGKQGIDGDSLFTPDKHAVYRNDYSPGDLVLRSDIVMPDDPEFIDLMIASDCVPYAVAVAPESVVGGIIRAGSYVDVLALTGVSDNKLELDHFSEREITISPVLSHIRVLKIEPGERDIGADQIRDHLILELTRKQVARLTIAKQVAKLEVYKSAGVTSAKDLRANAGDVLPDFKAVKELRANRIVVK